MLLDIGRAKKRLTAYRVKESTYPPCPYHKDVVAVDSN